VEGDDDQFVEGVIGDSWRRLRNWVHGRDEDVGAGGLDHVAAAAIMKKAWQMAHGRPPSDRELLFSLAWGAHEGRYGGSPPGNAEACRGSNNWGGVQETRPGEGCMASDTQPSGDRYPQAFKVYASPEEGAADLVRNLTKHRPNTWAKIQDEKASVYDVALGRAPRALLRRALPQGDGGVRQGRRLEVRPSHGRGDARVRARGRRGVRRGSEQVPAGHRRGDRRDAPAARPRLAARVAHAQEGARRRRHRRHGRRHRRRHRKEDPMKFTLNKVIVLGGALTIGVALAKRYLSKPERVAGPPFDKSTWWIIPRTTSHDFEDIGRQIATSWSWGYIAPSNIGFENEARPLADWWAEQRANGYAVLRSEDAAFALRPPEALKVRQYGRFRNMEVIT
jgi:hypothetical protein